MEQGQQLLSHLIHEYFYLRLRLGYYKCGDSLPPIDTICREFGVGYETAKAALRRLRDEGYIDLGRGRITRVLFHQSEQELQNFIMEHFSTRWDAFIDLYSSAGLLFAPLITEGFRRMSAQELDALSLVAQRAGEDDLLYFYCSVLQKLENSLAMNFFWETFLFQAFPLARLENRFTQYHVKDNRERMLTLISKAREQRWDCLHDALIAYRQTDISRITMYLQQQIKPLPKEEQIPFVWRIYRDRPQICYNLAARILHDVYIGDYCDISFLPSYAEMAQQYGVSVNTVRRAVGMLNSIGAAKSINGKGTLVYSLGKRCNPPDFSDPMIGRNLSFFIQSYELVLYTCEPVMRTFLTDLAPADKEKLVGQLERNLRCGRSDISFWHFLLAIATHSRLQVVREFYRTIYGLFLWGYPLKASHDRSPDWGMETFTESMILHLKDNDIDQCAVTLKNLIAKLYPPTEGYLLKNGIEPKERRIANSIRFLTLENKVDEQTE